MRLKLFTLLIMSSFVFGLGCDDGSDGADDCALGQCPGDDYSFFEQGDGPPPEVEEPADHVNFPVGIYTEELAQVIIPIMETPVMEEELTFAEQARVDVLRSAISQGLDLGRLHYLEAMTLALQDLDIVDDYEALVLDGNDALSQDIEDCPFVKYYDNGFEPTGLTCDYLVDMAKVEVYSELTKLMDGNPLPGTVQDSTYLEAGEARFWYEQGTISGIEEHRILVRSDLRARGLCSKNPTPVESSRDNGVLVGRQLFAEHFNLWLGANSYVADYPVMSQPITVCNTDITMLEPARLAAMNMIKVTLEDQPLCKIGYEPPDMEAQFQFSQAKIDYELGIEWGIQDEFALAGVRVFEVVPCNIGDPIVVDLDGDGIELLAIQDGVNFDLWAAGHKQAMAWAHPDDGFLVLDRNENGRVDDGSEFFGNVDGIHEHGFDHLAALDTTKDGVLSAKDQAFKSLRIWQDRNSNGISDSGEMLTLDAVGIDSIPLGAQKVALTVNGNRIPYSVMATGPAGERTVADVFLRTALHARVSDAR